jgi:hypothetical protein
MQLLKVFEGTTLFVEDGNGRWAAEFAKDVNKFILKFNDPNATVAADSTTHTFPLQIIA